MTTPPLDDQARTAPPDDDRTETFTPVNFRELLDGDPPEQEWLVEPLIVARRHTGIIARRGDGKSLIALAIAVAKAVGDPLLDQPEGNPIHVVYIDQEMGLEDLYDRVSDLGYTTDHPKFDLLEEHLHYYQLIDLPPLNTPEGGDALEEIVDRHSAEFLVIDTLSRVVKGDENTTEPYQDLWNYTEKRLKRRGNVTYLRLDHLGKDSRRGSRGASAKEDPLDIVYELKVGATGKLFFNKTKGRQPWLPETVAVDRVTENGILTHRTEIQFAQQWLLDLVAEIDQLGIPEDAGTPAVQKALQERGRGRRRNDIAKAVRFRKGRAQGGPENREHPGTPSREHPREHPGTPHQETSFDLGELNGNTPGNTREQGSGPTTPYRGGTTPNPNTDEFDAETERIAPR